MRLVLVDTLMSNIYGPSTSIRPQGETMQRTEDLVALASAAEKRMVHPEDNYPFSGSGLDVVHSTVWVP
jgi:hypothetical protein